MFLIFVQKISDEKEIHFCDGDCKKSPYQSFFQGSTSNPGIFFSRDRSLNFVTVTLLILNNISKSLITANTLGIDGGPVTMSCWIKLNSEISTGVYTFLDQANNGSKTNYIIDYNFKPEYAHTDMFLGPVGVYRVPVSASAAWAATILFAVLLMAGLGLAWSKRRRPSL